MKSSKDIHDFLGQHYEHASDSFKEYMHDYVDAFLTTKLGVSGDQNITENEFVVITKHVQAMEYTSGQ